MWNRETPKGGLRWHKLLVYLALDVMPNVHLQILKLHVKCINWFAPIALFWASFWHTAPLCYGCPEFESRLEDSSRSCPPLSLLLHFLSVLICPIIIKGEMPKINHKQIHKLKPHGSRTVSKHLLKQVSIHEEKTFNIYFNNKNELNLLKICLKLSEEE